jgi:hypothetical protein
LALFQESVGAEYDAVGVPKPDEPEAPDGFELEESIAERVDLLLVLGKAMIAGVIEEVGEFGEFLRMESRRLSEEVFRRAIRAGKLGRRGRIGREMLPREELTYGLKMQGVFQTSNIPSAAVFSSASFSRCGAAPLA